MPPANATRILMVDDDQLTRNIQRSLLEDLGYVIVGEANDGLQALTFTQELCPDVVVMDIRMPNMDGITATRHIQENYPTPIVLLSAHDSPNLLTQASDAGAGAYLIKPARPNDLQRAISIAIARFEDGLKLRELNVQLQDLTQQLARSNADLQQFAYAVSHDLQAPLRTVAGFLALLEQQHSAVLDDDGQVLIQYAQNGAKRMQMMIEGLLNYSRVTTHGNAIVPTDCEALLKRVLSDIHFTLEQHRARVTYTPLPTVMGDASQLRRVFQNLILNAVKFQPVDPGHSPTLHITAERDETDASLWCFAVQDNGIGIPKKHTERLFQVFQRLHTQEEYPGTGIGLAMCRKIIERHGGRIWFESVVGEGSTFYFTLPGEEAKEGGRAA